MQNFNITKDTFYTVNIQIQYRKITQHGFKCDRLSCFCYYIFIFFWTFHPTIFTSLLVSSLNGRHDFRLPRLTDVFRLLSLHTVFGVSLSYVLSASTALYKIDTTDNLVHVCKWHGRNLGFASVLRRSSRTTWYRYEKKTTASQWLWIYTHLYLSGLC